MFKKGYIPWNKGQRGITGKWMLGKKLSEKHKINIGIANKRRKISEEHKGKLREAKWRENHWRWKGGRFEEKRGYILVLKPEHPFCNKNGYIFEHRIVIEEYIKRFLQPTDNRPQNLIALTASAHMTFENTGILKENEIIFDGRLFKEV